MATVTMQVTIPAGYAPGMNMPVSGPTGQVVYVQVPMNAAPGTTIQFQVPATTTTSFQEQQQLQAQQQARIQLQQRILAQQQEVQRYQQPSYQQPSYQQPSYQPPATLRQPSPSYSSGYGGGFTGASSFGRGDNEKPQDTNYLITSSRLSQFEGIKVCCCISRDCFLDCGDLSLCLVYCCTAPPGIGECIPCCTQRLTIIGQDELAIIENFEKFDRIQAAGPALLFAPCCFPFEAVRARLSLRVQQFSVTSETKTKDNVFCYITITLQYSVVPDMAKEAYYSLESFQGLVEPTISDLCRNLLAKMELDRALMARDMIQAEMKIKLTEVLQPYGFVVEHILVTDLTPDSKVKTEMNAIYASKMGKFAAQELAEAQKIISIKIGEGEAERKALMGSGTARQRAAIAAGLEASLSGFADSVTTDSYTMDRNDALYIQMLLNYFDTLANVAARAMQPPSLFLNSSTSAVRDMRDSIQVGTVKTKTSPRSSKSPRGPKPGL